MGKAIDVAVGQPIPLQVQEGLKDGTKVIKATLYNMADNSVIASNVILAHIGDGFYKNTSQTMPDAPFVLAQYQVFDADGLTPNSTGDQAVSDLFKKAETSVIGGVVQDRSLEAVISNDQQPLVAKVADESGSLTAKIDAGEELKAILEPESESLKASLDDNGSLEAQLD